ncbi:phage tail protein I [Fusobacterium necrophorum subsp. funduliforme 1_1_36S]|nr:phage tail protein I [Fusobacterium necrophorum subsp. funduliforme 1_1_36S]
MNNLQNTEYSEIFPENLKKYRNLIAFSNVIEKIIKEYILFDSEKIAIFYSLEFQKDKVLDEIAWGLNIDNYSTDLDRDVKISLIKGAYWIHSNKGTKNAVIAQLKN